MLLQRTITASILVPLVVLAIFQLPPEYFSLLLAVILLGAAWEWSSIIGLQTLSKKILFLLTLIVPMLWLHFWTYFLEWIAQLLDWPDVRYYSGALEWLVIAPVIFWILAMLLIRNAPTGLLNLKLRLRYKALIGWLIFLSAWMFLSRLRAFYGAEMTLYLLILIWIADIAAYFAGKKFGKIQLAPEISPGKTIQGMYGALITCSIWSTVFIGYYAYRDGFNWMRISDFILLSIITVLISIYGDLFISVAKRQAGIKDTGSLLPGHGGILDRLDSLIAAIPFFYAGIVLIGLSS